MLTCLVNSVSWAPHELGAILACASSDGKLSVLTFKGNESSDLTTRHPQKKTFQMTVNGVQISSTGMPSAAMLFLGRLQYIRVPSLFHSIPLPGNHRLFHNPSNASLVPGVTTSSKYGVIGKTRCLGLKKKSWRDTLTGSGMWLGHPTLVCQGVTSPLPLRCLCYPYSKSRWLNLVFIFLLRTSPFLSGQKTHRHRLG
jgi:hypothetical protein